MPLCRASLPMWVSPMLVRSGRGMPVDLEDWAIEPKWDGWRCLARFHGGSVGLTSRWRRDLTPLFPELTELPSGLAASRLLLDGRDRRAATPRQPRLPRPHAPRPPQRGADCLHVLRCPPRRRDRSSRRDVRGAAPGARAAADDARPLAYYTFAEERGGRSALRLYAHERLGGRGGESWTT